MPKHEKSPLPERAESSEEPSDDSEEEEMENVSELMWAQEQISDDVLSALEAVSEDEMGVSALGEGVGNRKLEKERKAGSRKGGSEGPHSANWRALRSQISGNRVSGT